jgi:iron complex outermembrane recepter protein
VDVQIHGPIATQDEDNTPHHMAQFRSYYDLTDDIELNGALYYVDNVPAVDVPSYLRMDLGLTWRLTPNFEVAAWGQNLLQRRHREFSQFNHVERGFYLMGTLRF